MYTSSIIQSTIVQNPVTINVLNLMLSLLILLSLSSADVMFGHGVSLFIGLSSLTVSAFAVGIIGADLHDKFARLQCFQSAASETQLKWKHIQFTYAIILFAMNLTGTILNAVLSSHSFSDAFTHSYSTAAFFSAALCLSFLITAIVSLYKFDSDVIEIDRAQIVSKSDYDEL